MGQQDTNDRSGYAPTYYPGTGNVAEAQRLTIAQGQTLTAVNLTLLPTQTVRASGIVVDAQGRPMGNVGVSAMQGFSGMGYFGGQTKPDGTFTINGLTPGEYTLRANLQGNQEQAVLALRIDGSDVTDLQLMVTKPSTIRGRVAFEEGGTPPKASAIRVTAMRADSVVGAGGGVAVKDDLSFEMPLPAGRVFVRSPAHRTQLAAEPRPAERHRRHRQRRRRAGQRFAERRRRRAHRSSLPDQRPRHRFERRARARLLRDRLRTGSRRLDARHALPLVDAARARRSVPREDAGRRLLCDCDDGGRSGRVDRSRSS